MKRLAVLALALAPTVARADALNLSSIETDTNRVEVTTGAEYAFVAGIGYRRVLPFQDRQIVVGGDIELPWAGLDLGDYRVRASALLPIVDTRYFKLAGSLAPLVRGTSSGIGTLTDVGVDTSLIAGFYTPRWFAAAEFGFDAALTTHVTHSDAYRMQADDKAVDGWYGNAGGNLRAGLQVGVTIARYDASLRVGQVRDLDGDPPLFPLYGTVTVGRRW